MVAVDRFRDRPVNPSFTLGPQIHDLDAGAAFGPALNVATPPARNAVGARRRRHGALSSPS